MCLSVSKTGIMEKYFVILISLGIFLFCAQEGSSVNDKDALSYEGVHVPLIIGGEVVLDPVQIPHQVALFVYPTKENETMCEGSLVSPRFVVTAAVCFDTVVAPNFVVIAYFGVTNLSDPDIGRLAEKVIIHPMWNRDTMENNLAIVEVRPVPLSDKVKPIRLPSKSQESNSFNLWSAKISGRGLSSNDDQGFNKTLREVSTKVVPNIYCKTRYLSKTLKDSNICTSFIGSEGICKGDEGGPLFIREDDGNDTLIGVASFKDSNCQSSLPSVFTRVTSYLEWINGLTSIPLRP